MTYSALETLQTLDSVSYNADLSQAYGVDTPSLNRQRKIALAQVDKATFSVFHFKVFLVAGAGFFTDAYDLFAISIASVMLGLVYGPRVDGITGLHVLTPNQDLGLKIAAPLGSIIGQIFFGWLADRLGRKRMYGVELSIMILGTFSQTLMAEGRAVNIIWTLMIWRFFTGIGIGGDYPMSAVIASEFSSIGIRGRLMTAVFASQGWGSLVASLVSMILVTAFRKSLQQNDQDLNAVDTMWRILIGLGCIPGVLALYFRLTIPESPRFTADIERNVQRAAQEVEMYLKDPSIVIDPDAVYPHVDAPRASKEDFLSYFGKWQNLKVLIGTCSAWFFQDVAFYGLGLNSATVLKAVSYSPSINPCNATSPYSSLFDIAVETVVISVGGLLPGYYATFFFIDKWGRIPIQNLGFAALTLLFIILGGTYDSLRKTPTGQRFIFVLYCLANFFQNFGPNSTTFIIPGEAFPTRYRSTAHGLSAASGRLGIVIAQLVVFFLEKSNEDTCSPTYVRFVWLVLAVFMFLGFLATRLIPETKNRSLEDISNEPQENFIRGFSSASGFALQELSSTRTL